MSKYSAGKRNVGGATQRGQVTTLEGGICTKKYDQYRRL